MSYLYVSTFRAVIAATILVGLGIGAVSVSAQEAETAKIVTADGVRLHAVFYASQKKNPATVIMLHPIGDGKSSKSQEWKKLATDLQKADYSVLMFDFRGHGESTTIEDPTLFWSKAPNVMNVRVKDKKDETINVKDYIKAGGAYLPVLVNDIAAVRAYLDRRNDDTKDCNTSSLIVIGADSGATLGALWMNAEWHRYKFTPNPMFPQLVNLTMLDKRPEGKDIVAAVFLTPQPALEKRSVSLTGLLRVACKDNATAAVFFCGDEDAKARNLATQLENNLKTKGKKHEYIGAFKLKTNLSGVKLLQDGLQSNSYIVKYLDNVLEDRKNDRVERDFMNTYFVWKLPFSGQLLPARNDRREKSIIFNDYNKFITQ